MKHGVVLLCVAAGLGWAGWHLAGSGTGQSTTAGQPEVQVGKIPFRVIHDKSLVFERAFWKRPGSADEILHAERREWVDGGGLQKWQWFIVVRPSDDLARHLRTNNAFGLSAEARATLPADAPEWFRHEADHLEVMKAPGGRMTLAFSRDGLLYGTDSGGGFYPGKPLAERVAETASTPSGRLPTSPPPAP